MDIQNDFEKLNFLLCLEKIRLFLYLENIYETMVLFILIPKMRYNEGDGTDSAHQRRVSMENAGNRKMNPDTRVDLYRAWLDLQEDKEIHSNGMIVKSARNEDAPNV